MQHAMDLFQFNLKEARARLAALRPSGAPVNRDTLLRQWAMLQLIPREPRKIPTSEVVRRLKEGHGHKITPRSIQRDLMKLASVFGFLSEEVGRSLVWYWPKTSRLVDLPAMDAPAAVALLLSREHLAPLLPPATMKLISPYFSKAEEVLHETPGALTAWRERVCVRTRGPHLQGPKVPDEVQSEVYEAVLNGKQLSIQYKGRGQPGHSEQRLHPLGIVVYDGVTYLIATAKDYTNPVMYALHRMRSAKVLVEDAKRIKGFSLARYAATQFRFPLSEEMFHLVARFSPKAVAEHLGERPLAPDQTIKEVDGCAEVSATVADTDDLRWWLLGFGDRVEVLKPAKLRADMKKAATAMANHYSD